MPLQNTDIGADFADVEVTATRTGRSTVVYGDPAIMRGRSGREIVAGGNTEKVLRVSGFSAKAYTVYRQNDDDSMIA